MRTDYTYNSTGQLSAIKYFDTADLVNPMESYGYTYDDRGFIATEDIDSTYLVDGTAVTTDIYKVHTYDDIGRLKQSDVTVDGAATPATTNWTYDNVGNRLTQTDSDGMLDYDYNEFNQLVEIDTIVSGTTYEYMDYTYNTRGGQATQIETVSGGTDITTSYAYDAAGRLAKTDDGTDISKNFFNGKGQRIRQELNPGANVETTKYYYTGGALLFTTDDDNDKLTENIVTPGGSVIASQRYEGEYANEFYFYNYDIRQSTTSILDNSFNLMQGYEYDEFGNQTVTGDTGFLNEVTFTGAISDSTGLQYMNARFYNPNTGRFLTQDTYTGNAYEPWSQHLYSYTGNNPVNYVDPTGHVRINNVTMTDTGNTAEMDERKERYIEMQKVAAMNNWGENTISKSDAEKSQLDFENVVEEWTGSDIEFVKHISTTSIPNDGDSYVQDQADATAMYLLGLPSGGGSLLVNYALNYNRHETIDVYEVGGTYMQKYYCRTLINEELGDVQGVTVPYQYKYVTVYFNSPNMIAENIEYIYSQNDGPPRGAYND